MADEYDAFRSALSEAELGPQMTERELLTATEAAFGNFIAGVKQFDALAKQRSADLEVRIFHQITNTETRVSRYTVTLTRGTDYWATFDAEMTPERLLLRGPTGTFTVADGYSPAETSAALREAGDILAGAIKMRSGR